MLTTLKKVFANHISRELKELYLSSAILRLATSSIALFEPIYFLKVGMSVGDILAFFGVLYVLYFFGLPIGGRLARMHGYEHVMLWSSPFLILYYASLFAIPYHPFYIFLALISAVIYKCLYWSGYHADFARFGKSRERGKELSSFSSLLSAVAVVAPIFGGWIIFVAGFRTLFIIVSALILVSNIPLLTTPEKFTPVEFSYGAAMKEVFRKKNWRQTLAFLGYGEDLIGNLIWPIFIATVVKNLFSLGALISVSTLVNIILLIGIGSFVDRHRRLPVERLGAVFNSLVWLGMTLVRTGFGVFIFDNLSKIAGTILGIPFVSIVYDEAKNSSVMTVMIYREMGLALGKMLGAGVAILVWLRFPDKLELLFVVAACFSLLYLLLQERIKKDGVAIPPTQENTLTGIV